MPVFQCILMVLWEGKEGDRVVIIIPQPCDIPGFASENVSVIILSTVAYALVETN